MESTQASPKGAPSLTAGSERDTQRPRGLGNSSSAQLPPSSSSSSPSAVCADSMMLPMLAIWKLRTRRGCAEGTPPVSARVAWAKRPRSAAAAAPQRAPKPREGCVCVHPAAPPLWRPGARWRAARLTMKVTNAAQYAQRGSSSSAADSSSTRRP